MKLIFTLFIFLVIFRIPENVLVVVTFTVFSISPVRLSFYVNLTQVRDNTSIESACKQACGAFS